MRAPLLFRGLLAVFCFWAGTMTAQASHVLGAELTYEYAGTAANPFQYHVKVRIFSDITNYPNAITDPRTTLVCGRNECGTTLPGSFSTDLMRTIVTTSTSGCTGRNLAYEVNTLEGLVQLPPARWTLSVNFFNRAVGVVNVVQSENQSTYVKAVLDNTSGLINTSPQFTTARLIQLTSTQAQQRYSLSAFDSEGDSLVYQLVQPLAAPTAGQSCGTATVGALAPHFQMNAATGELLTVAGPNQQGRYALAARVDEYRRVNGGWAQIGSITRDMTYFLSAGANQVPVFTRVALSSAPGGQLLGQAVRVSPGQTVSLALTATDADAGQQLTMVSEAAGVVPGVTFQNLSSGQGRLTWQVPANLPLGRYNLSATVSDNACPANGMSALTLPFVVSQQALATRGRQPLAEPPFPMPFPEEVRFQFAGLGNQPVIIVDELGRTVQQLTTALDGRVMWRPAATLPAGLYIARNLDNTQVARLFYSGH